MAFVQHRHDQMHRGAVPADQLADGAPDRGDVPTFQYDGSVAWEPQTGGGSAPPLDNTTATTDPSSTDDSGGGYSVLSRWLNTSTQTIWICASAAVGAAVWNSAGPGADGATWDDGPGAPDSLAGTDGDYYLETS